MAPPLLHGRAAARLEGTAEWVAARDGTRLRAALFPPRAGPARGSVVLNSGRTEPIEKHAEAVGELQSRGFTVMAHDWRGQGLSERFPRSTPGMDGVTDGHARGWRRFVADLSQLLDAYAERLPRPWLALGHSMGGALTLLGMAEGETRFDGAALLAPMLGLRLGGRPQALVQSVAALMTFFGQARRATPPALPRHEGQGGAALTHDRERWARFTALLDEAPELRLGEPTWGWLQFAFAVIDRLKAPGVLEKITAPVSIVGAGRDRLVANAPQRAAAARLPNGWYVENEGAFHEMLMETDERRGVVWRAFDQLTVQVALQAPVP